MLFSGTGYAESVGQTILARLLMAGRAGPEVNPLSKWRLLKVQRFIEAHISERITLADLAAASGLSRMHFAAQFRTATGYRPHDYLLLHRIECAKMVMAQEAMPLVEVALSFGFQTQPHFTTVFKRMTGETPARWRRTHRASVPATSHPRRDARAARVPGFAP